MPIGITVGRRTRLFVLGITLLLVSGALAGGAVAVYGWMETAEFCSSCHVMKPQLQAHGLSPHAGVECAQCHIPHGLEGFVHSKIDGTAQLISLLTGTYARPIPPAGHKMVRSAAAENCMTCHRAPPTNQDRLVVRSSFSDDENNTEQDVTLIVKLAERPGDGLGRGIHWHVFSKVEFAHPDERGLEIDYVRVTQPSGEEQVYATKGAMFSQRRREEITQATASGKLEHMTCITCHNRVGHEFQPPNRALDDALARGTIDRGLPYVKKMSLELLASNFSSTEEALEAIRSLEDFYQESYPGLYADKQRQIQRTIQALEEIFSLVAIPEMDGTYRSYPTFLGHQDTAGCFRCHNGSHFLLTDQQTFTTSQQTLTNQTISASCSTCHTVPRIGNPRNGTLDDRRPVSHPQTMLFDHTAVIRESGGTSACALCHQPPFCARCHEQEPLGSTHPQSPPSDQQ
jgi:nitrate/TMAO reductase-like tetraheme cytochrome c subunit